jgi:hypothetical protein
MQAFHSLHDHGRVRPWLFRILSRLVVDRHRSVPREVPLDESIDLDRFLLYDRIAEEDPFPYRRRSTTTSSHSSRTKTSGVRCCRFQRSIACHSSSSTRRTSPTASWRSCWAVRSARSCPVCTAVGRRWSERCGTAPVAADG